MLNEQDFYFSNQLRVETDYVVFEPAAPKPNTKVWKVLSRRHGDLLGYVKWFANWRQYTFWPEAGTTWSKGCLDDVSNFLMHVNEEHRLMASERRKNR